MSKYLLFEKSAIESLVSKTGFQSIEFSLGKDLIDYVCGDKQGNQLDNLCIKNEPGKGVLFVGKSCEKTFLLFDLTQCNILVEKKSPESLLLILQKVFRTAIRIWNHQPFTSSERVHGTKSIVFPFVFTDHRRVVIERAPKCERLSKRGIDRPLLVYKYGTEDAPRGEEIANTSVLRDGGETYLSQIPIFQRFFQDLDSRQSDFQPIDKPLLHTTVNEHVSDGGFMYLNYEQQLSKLTLKQRSVVENKNIVSPIRIDGPAGTGKTASMILRSYFLLKNARAKSEPFSIVFFAHSESTKCEIESAFSLLENADSFLSEKSSQHIVFTTLFAYCIETIRVNSSQVIEHDANDAKQSQRILIEEAFDKVYKEKFRTFKPLLSGELCKVFDTQVTPKGVLISMLQHEFSIQIKGRTDCTIEEYYQIPRISNALPVETQKDKEFVFSIFLEYQNMLRISSVYDIDDITVQALAQWNAPIWRRERRDLGFDYIFVDEMHLFNINEQHVFHYLTKSAEQKQIPICFALDYGQAIGDRGNTNRDYIETAFGEVERNDYKTVFRCSQQITDFCAAISASGALMFQNDYRDPYDIAASGFTQQEEAKCDIPRLYMYRNEEEMIKSLKGHVDRFKQETQCKNYDIALISFEDTLLIPQNVEKLSSLLGKKMYVLKNRQTSSLSRGIKTDDPIILSDPYNVNGLEFKCVILFGVDEGRLPQNTGVSDISANYIKYIAFNQLYLASSRAKYRLVLIGNSLHGVSSCLQYALESGKLETSTQV